MATPIATVKTIGILVGFLLFLYAFAIAKLVRFERVSDRYASAFATVGLLVVLVASGGFTRPPANYGLELAGYLVAVVGATVAFWRIADKKSHFEEA